MVVGLSGREPREIHCPVYLCAAALGSLSLPDDGVSVTEYPVLLPACIQPSSAIPPTDNPVPLHLPATALPTQLADVLQALKHADA